jgi:thiosulfate/3-mercaptopyruvate sulfurtransferase
MKSLRLATLLLAASGAVNAVELPGAVVTPAWLNEHRAAVVVLDVRSDVDAFTVAPEYETDAKTGAKKLVSAGGHIADARLVDFNLTRVSITVGDKKIDKMLPGGDAVQSLMRGLGVGQDDVLVITSVGETSDEVNMAARLYWTLKTYGETDMALLDGGNVAWLAAGLPVSTAPMATVAAGDWTAGELDKTWFAGIDDLKPAGAAPMLIDARPSPQYHGLYFKKPSVAAGGHVAGALSFPIDMQTRQVGLAQTFMTAAQYAKVLSALDIKPQPGAISYCNTGHMAAGAWFVLSEIMKIDGVRLYDGSMHEWTTLGRPVVGIGL